MGKEPRIIMERKIELLAPGGGIDSIKAAIVAGANAVYCGLEKFSARDRAANIRIDDVNGVVRLAHQHNCSIFITLNIILLENEFPTVLKLLNKLANTNVDGVIVQDLGLLYLLGSQFKNLKIHGSTQLTTHNDGQIKFLSQLAVARVNLSRELNFNEIQPLSTVAHQHGVETEIFVHGANCVSFSGLCYMSSVNYGNSGNRGRCSQPCREEYVATEQNKRFPLNLKDNAAFLNLSQIWDTGVDSIKIEGRIKKSNYVYAVVDTWKKQLQRLYNNEVLATDTRDLRLVYHRDFSNSFFTGALHKDAFIDNPKDFSAKYLLQQSGAVTDDEIKKANKKINEEKKALIETVKEKIEKLSIAKAPLVIRISGRRGIPLTVSIYTPEVSFHVHSKSILSPVQSSKKVVKKKSSPDADAQIRNADPNPHTEQLTQQLFYQKFKSISNTEYHIEELQINHLERGLFVPYEELTHIKKQILFVLMGNRDMAPRVQLPRFKTEVQPVNKPRLSVLLSSVEDLHLLASCKSEFFFELPNGVKKNQEYLTQLFKNNRQMNPWFPAVLIGEDYTAATALLQEIQPKKIVTNNLGIAHEAFNSNIPWIAGPHLNIANSFGLNCLKTNFHCLGAFISNELNLSQIKKISPPLNMELYYSIFHPITLLTSRQCLFHQVTGCPKNHVDNTCIEQCEKSSNITNMKDVTSFIVKTKGTFHCIYAERHFLNTKIGTDMPRRFSSFFIDLKNVNTHTKIEATKPEIIHLFEKHIGGCTVSTTKLHQLIYPTTVNQYTTGI